MSTHEHYEELCALAVTGQASVEELADLRSHLEDCPSCRGIAYDFSALSAQGLSALAAKRLHSQIPIGMAQRFVARAHSEGIEISEAVTPKGENSGWLRSAFRPVAVGTAAATVVIFTSFFVLKSRFQRPSVASGHIVSISAPVSANASSDHVTDADAHIKDELQEAQRHLVATDDVVKELRAELQRSKSDINALTSQLAEAQQNSISQREKTDQESRVKQLEAELQSANSEKDATAVALAAQESELRQLHKEVTDQAQALKEQQMLTGRGSDVQDLVVARNLHIIDVHDRDGNGKSQRTFGRIFYTEGRSLIFYAYDLADPHKLNAKVSFHVWGERLGSEKPIQSLGVLHNDDAADGRWALTFDDPQVLAQIDSVFVTAETSPKVAKEPRGERILFAFLGGKPNHP